MAEENKEVNLEDMEKVSGGKTISNTVTNTPGFFTCTKCGLQFTSAALLAAHKQKSHRESYYA